MGQTRVVLQSGWGMWLLGSACSHTACSWLLLLRGGAEACTEMKHLA